jgi:hypothetical protein
MIWFKSLLIGAVTMVAGCLVGMVIFIIQVSRMTNSNDVGFAPMDLFRPGFLGFMTLLFVAGFGVAYWRFGKSQP